MLVLIAFGALVLLAALVPVALVAGYAGLRRRYVAEVARRAVRAERGRLAEDLHDLIGHDLALVAVQAGALQVRLDGEDAAAAERIRAAANRAAGSLREVTGVLADGDRTPPVEVAGSGLDRLVDDARAAGLVVHARLDPLGDVSEPVRLTVARVVREALTNAARHAPGSPLTLEVERDAEQVRVSCRNPLTAPAGSRSSGLAALRRRVELLSGSFESGSEEGIFVLSASLPGYTRIAPSAPARGPRAPAVELLHRVWPATAVILAAGLGFYTWATHGASVEPATVATLRVGMPEQQAAALLPGRQAPVRLYREAATPPGRDCRRYTDGNAPLGLATVRVCFADGRLVAVQDLTENL